MGELAEFHVDLPSSKDTLYLNFLSEQQARSAQKF